MKIRANCGALHNDKHFYNLWMSVANDIIFNPGTFTRSFDDFVLSQLSVLAVKDQKSVVRELRNRALQCNRIVCTDK